MICLNLLSKSLNLGRHTLTLYTHIRLVAPKISPTFFSKPFSILKLKNEIQLPEKPKKPASPFFKFIQVQRPILQKEYPQLKITEIVKKCSEDWKNVHSSMREKYEIEYKEEMEMYAKKYMEYSVKLSEEQKTYIKELSEERRRISKKRKIKKKLKELNKPKKPPSAFLIYLMDQAKIQNRKLKELMKEAGSSWENMEESKKLSYNEQAKLAKATYLKELENWETKMLEEGKANVVRVKTLEEKRPMSSKKAKEAPVSKKKNPSEKKLKE